MFRYKLRWGGGSLVVLLIVLVALLEWARSSWFDALWIGPLGTYKYIWIFIFSLVVLGPGLAFILASPKKSRIAGYIDTLLIVFIQICLLGIGFYWFFQQRPVILAFEKDRFVLVKASEVDEHFLNEAPVDLKKVLMPRSVVLKAATRDAKNVDELMQGIQLSLDGLSPAYRPSWWILYDDEVVNRIVANGEKISNLSNYNNKSFYESNDFKNQEIRYLPLVTSNSENWGVMFLKTGQIVGVLECEEYCN